MMMMTDDPTLAELDAAVDEERAQLRASIHDYSMDEGLMVDIEDAITALIAAAEARGAARMHDRLAAVTAQRDALVPLIDYYFEPTLPMMPSVHQEHAADAALAAIRAEREEGTTLHIHSMSAHKILHGTDA
jgi:hypothetical protein